MKKISNSMETFVMDFLDEVLAEYPGICKCKKCKREMAAYALNRLPPKYTTTDLGELYTKSSVLDNQSRADIIRALILGIESVKGNPRHPFKSVK